jgi:ParB family chromosome partitioning protein
MVRMARDIVRRGLSVREVERLVRAARKNPAAGEGGSPPDPYAHFPGGAPAVQRVSEDLMRSLGTKVRIVPLGKKGKIEVDFSSSEELDRLIDLIRR